MSFLKFAKNAFTLSGGSGLYDRARPTYPAEVLKTLQAQFPGRSNLVVYDVAAGTGKFTELLVRLRAEDPERPIVGSITAVEPSAGMRSSLEANIKKWGASDFTRVVDATFDHIPADSDSVDLIVVAQAFHWTGRDPDAALSEFARILKRGTGRLALVWNLEDGDTEWVKHVRDTYEAYEDGTPQYRLGLWKAAFSSEPYKRFFGGAVDTFSFSQKLPTDPPRVVERALSKSYLSVLADAEKAKVTQGIYDILEKYGSSKEYVDSSKKEFYYPYKTDLFVFKRGEEAV